MQCSVSFIVHTVYIAVSIRDQQLHHVQVTITVDEMEGTRVSVICSYTSHITHHRSYYSTKERSPYRIALKFGRYKNLRIAVFERFFEIISQIRCSNTTHPRTNEFMGGAYLSIYNYVTKMSTDLQEAK